MPIRSRSPFFAWVLLGIFAFGMLGCSTGPRSKPLVNGFIDDFDDSNVTNVFGHIWQEVAEGAGSYARVSIEPRGYGDSRFHLTVEGGRPPSPSGAHAAGVKNRFTDAPMMADPRRSEIARDVSAYDGFAFAIQGTPGTYIVQLRSALIEDGDFYNAYVQVSNEWTEYKLPFSEFRQEGYGKSQPWTGDYITDVVFFANVTGPFKFGIDNVRFFKD